MPMVIENILSADGIHLPKGGGAEKSIKCFSPTHDDKEPSMSVNIAKGVYNCHGCGIRGNAYTYLTDIKGLSPQEAMIELERAGATDIHAKKLADKGKKKGPKFSQKAVLVKEIPPNMKMKGGNWGKLVHEHKYTDLSGKHVYSVARYEFQEDNKEKPEKTFRQYTVAEGGYYAAGPLSEQLPLEVQLRKYFPFGAHELYEEKKAWVGRPDAEKRQIWVVEGEKCVLAIRNIKDAPGGKGPPPVVTLCGGAKMGKADFSDHELALLYGEKVLLIADADDAGRAHMKWLGKHLSEHGSQVHYVMPPGSTKEDIGDVAADGWKAVVQFVRKAGGSKKHDEVHVKGEKAKKEDVAPIPPMADNNYFQVLGTEGECIIFQQKTTHKILKLFPQQLFHDGNLIALAPLMFWQAMAGGKEYTKAHKVAWADSMIRKAEMQGEISTTATQMWGRGAVKTKDGKLLYNLGNKLLVADPTTNLMSNERPLAQGDIKEIFLPGPEIILHDDEKAAIYCEDMYEAVMSYRWENEDQGNAFCGWLVSSLVGGALPFRPMLWLTAKAGSGKTFLLENVISKFHDGVISEWANATEAGMAAQTQDSALPAYLDEFEPNSASEAKMQGILGLIRIATSGGAGRSRGNASGGYTITRPRFSLMIASIDRPVLSDADDQRITPIALGKPVPNWPKVRDDIIKAMMPHRCLAMRTHIIRNTANIVKMVSELEEEISAGGKVETRAAQIRAALSAGVRFLTTNNFILPARPERLKKENRPLHALMQAIVRVEWGDDMTIAEALTAAWFPKFSSNKDAENHEFRDRVTQICEKHGFRFIDGDSKLALAIDWQPMRNLLARTEFSHIDLDEYLFSIPGSARLKTAKGEPKRIMFAKQRSGAIYIPRDKLSEMGLFDFGQML